MKQDIIEKLVRPIIREISPYRSARDEFEDFDAQKIFLDANENPFDNGLNRYPDPLQRNLKRTLAKIKQVNEEQILLGNGSDEVLDLIIRTFCEPGEEEVLVLPPTYGMYAVLAKLNNVSVKEVPLNKNFEIEIDSVIEVVNPKTKIIFVCSPNNPSGNTIPLDQIKELLKNFSGIIVIDEAYIDFSQEKSALSLLDQYPQLLVCQTFSKAYGLAGIRLGMCFANPLVIDYFNKIKPPYIVNSLTQSRALVKLGETESIKDQVIELISERKMLEQELKQFDFVTKIYPSDANFLLIIVDDANKRYNQFLKEGVGSKGLQSKQIRS